MKEAVNHPAHYNAGSIEVIEAIEAWQLGFCDGNVIKYVARFRHKNGVEDLRKAKWYLERLIKQEQEKEKDQANVRLQSNPGQHSPVRQAADDDHSNLPPVHSLGNYDASGSGSERGEQPSDSVGQDASTDCRESSDSACDVILTRRFTSRRSQG